LIHPLLAQENVNIQIRNQLHQSQEEHRENGELETSQISTLQTYGTRMGQKTTKIKQTNDAKMKYFPLTMMDPRSLRSFQSIQEMTHHRNLRSLSSNELGIEFSIR